MNKLRQYVNKECVCWAPLKQHLKFEPLVSMVQGYIHNDTLIEEISYIRDNKKLHIKQEFIISPKETSIEFTVGHFTKNNYYFHHFEDACKNDIIEIYYFLLGNYLLAFFQLQSFDLSIIKMSKFDKFKKAMDINLAIAILKLMTQRHN